MLINQKEVFFKKRMRNFIRHLDNHLEKDAKLEMRDILKWREGDYQKFNEGRLEIDAITFSNLSDHFKFSLQAFWENKIDFQAIRELASGKEGFLLEKYKLAATSLCSSVAGPLKYIESYHGLGLRKKSTDYLQIGNFPIN